MISHCARLLGFRGPVWGNLDVLVIRGDVVDAARARGVSARRKVALVCNQGQCWTVLVIRSAGYTKILWDIVLLDSIIPFIASELANTENYSTRKKEY